MYIGKTAMILGSLGLASVLGVSTVMLQPKEEEHFLETNNSVGAMNSGVVGSTSSTQTTAKSQNTYRNVMYYSDWSIWDGQGNFYPQDLPTHLYTHLNFAFLDFDSAGNLMFTDKDAAVGASLNQEGVTWGDVNSGILPVLRAERASNPSMKLGISVGGWSKSGDFPTMASNVQTRANFVQNMMKFLEYTDFDFIDLDWEYPGAVRQADYTDNQLDEGNPAASPQDKENYIKLLTELRTAMDLQGERLGKTYELSVALPMDKEKLQVGVDIPAMFDVINFANIMTYDARGAFDSVSGHHTPLYGNPADPMYDKGFSIDQSVNYLLSQGASAEKIVIGAAFYSRGWENISDTGGVTGLAGLFGTAGTGVSNADQSTSVGALNDLPLSVGDGGMAGGVWAYRNFDNLKATYTGLVEYWDDTAKAPYLYNGSAFFTYDNPQSLAEKTKYVRENNLGGVISWQAGNDKVTTTANQRDLLTQAIYDGLYQGQALVEYEIKTSDLDILVDIAPYTEQWSGSGLEIKLTNLERAEETGSVLREIELQKETIQMGKLYIDCGGLPLVTGGYGSGTVTQEGGFTVVDLSTVYENKNIAQGQSVTFRLKAEGEIVPTVDSVSFIVLTQRVTSSGVEISKQVIYGSGDGNTNGDGAQGENTGGGTTNPSPETAPNPEIVPNPSPEVTPSPSIPPVDTNTVFVWNREDEATGKYVTGVKVSHNGLIYQQVAEGTLWWEEPNPSSTNWQVIGEVEGYEPPAPTEWSREAEAIGTYVSGVTVTYQGKTYQQISGSTAWWCEPGTNDTVWQLVTG